MSPGYRRDTEPCVAIHEVLNLVGDKWSVLTVVALQDGSRRFNELRRHVHGVSQRMLTLTLRRLERDGLVSRTVYPTNPPRVDYALTPLGRNLLEPILALTVWAEQHRFEIQEARMEYDAQSENET